MNNNVLGIILNIIGSILLVFQASSIKLININLFWMVFVNLFAYCVIPLLMMIIDQLFITKHKYNYINAFVDSRLYPAQFSDFVKRIAAIYSYTVLPIIMIMPIEGLIPSIITILSYIMLGELINYKQFIGIILSFIGLIIVNIPNFRDIINIDKLYHIIFGIIAALIFVTFHSFNFIYMKKYVEEVKNLNVIEELYYNNANPFLLIVTSLIFMYFFRNKFNIFRNTINYINNKENFILTIFSLIITFILFGVTQNIAYFWSDNLLPGSIFGSLFSMQIIFGIITGYFLFNETVNIYTIIGSIIIIIGIIIVILYKKRDSDDKK